MHLWLRPYVLRKLKKAPETSGPIHVIFCFVDHYEPMWRNATLAKERERVSRWSKEYPEMAKGHLDADGKPPQHTFFYPEEEYREEHLDALTDLCRAGFGEVEVHLHHDNDTEEKLRLKLNRFCKTLSDTHGLLSRSPDTGKPVYAFIHGNWCLDNARPDGRWCGVNNEISILADTGCYADFTLPAAPDPSQTRTINSIYYATDDPLRPKSHDRGVLMSVGGKPVGDLLLIQGPLTLNWRDRKWGVIPRTENSDIRSGQPPSPERTDLWIREHIHVQGRPEWVFVKIHTHGTQDHDMDTLLGEKMDAMFTDLERRYNDGSSYCLHYVTAREMVNIAKAAESGKTGNPGDYRDFYLQPPPVLQD
ncbi:MAG: hypothetical protein AAF358_19055 [Pseudomonadota bacterium]